MYQASSSYEPGYHYLPTYQSVFQPLFQRPTYQHTYYYTTYQDESYPLLVLPRGSTTLNSLITTNNVLLDVNISTPDHYGNQITIYQGKCDVRIEDFNSAPENSYSEPIYQDEIPDNYQEFNNEPYYSMSSYYDDTNCEFSSNVAYNTEIGPDDTDYSSVSIEEIQNYVEYRQSSEFVQSENQTDEQSRVNFCNVKVCTYIHNSISKNHNVIYMESENEMNEQTTQDDINNNEIDSNSALMQLLSPDMQQNTKQLKTIMYVGNCPNRGQTLQQIEANNPSASYYRNSEKKHHVSLPASISNSIESVKKQYQCGTCSLIFPNIHSYKQHYTVTHKTNIEKIQCYKCGKIFYHVDDLNEHLLSHGNTNLECTYCFKILPNQAALYRHNKNHSQSYVCKYCSQKFIHESRLNIHLSLRHKVEILKCDFCDYKTSKSDELLYHTENEHGFKKLDDLCNTNSVVEMDEYEILKNADEALSKVLANQVFAGSKTQLHKKMKKINKKCNMCKKVFYRMSDLKRHLIEHIVTHTASKVQVNKAGLCFYKCPICDNEKFSKIDKLKAHLRKHAKLTLYECTFCDKSFSDSSNFSKHKKVHGDNYFQCDMCKRKFNSKMMIKQHMEYHSKNPPLKCNYCPKVFFFSSSLKKHNRLSHSNKGIQYYCKICFAGFSLLKAKWDHEWKSHKIRACIVDCDICNMKFRKFAELKKHCKDEHNYTIKKSEFISKENK